ncbi:MAG: transporter [Deferribacterota bacterium]|nr:transporter [Deferribacterota bacterium]
MKRFLINFILIIILKNFVYAQHVSLPQVNLGLTCILDGVAFPGLLFEQYVEYYESDRLNDNDGDSIAGKNKLDSLGLVTHLAYITDYKILGGYYGAEVVIPLVYLDIYQSSGPKGDEFGIGDITFTPLLIQWRDKLFNRDYFHRLAISGIFPSGDYDKNNNVNIGSHLYSFNPYYSFTYFITPKLTISSRIHYLLNSKNTKPLNLYNAENIKPGRAIHFNYSSTYEILKNFRVGISGYYLKQLSDSEIDGKNQNNSREEVFSFGPALYYITKNNIQFHFNYFHEFVSKNRPKGDKFVFRIAKSF